MNSSIGLLGLLRGVSGTAFVWESQTSVPKRLNVGKTI